MVSVCGTLSSSSGESSDVVGDVNRHTHGIEFYGTSSNFVLLNQFFAYARQHLPSGYAGSNDREVSFSSAKSVRASEVYSIQVQNSPRITGGVDHGPDLTPRSSISVVNLLSNGEALRPLSRPSTPEYIDETPQNGSRTCHRTVLTHFDDLPSTQLIKSSEESAGNFNSSGQCATKPVPWSPLPAAKKRLEQEYVGVFMNNLHHLHPMLDPIAFIARCDDIVWNGNMPLERNTGQRHFLALYSIVIAVGALTADSTLTQSLERDIKRCMKHAMRPQNSTSRLLSRELSKQYFRKAKALLGDVFEACSLDSTQTLLLMVRHFPSYFLLSYSR